MSRFLLHILAAFAELERELIRERVKARGKQVGRPKRIFRRDEVGRLRSEGVSWRAIAEALGIPVATLIDAYRTTKR
jgi:DNA invertase Pin-like site-specific DNA recombinase